jgi:hypothetical protein
MVIGHILGGEGRRHAAAARRDGGAPGLLGGEPVSLISKLTNYGLGTGSANEMPTFSAAGHPDG